MLSKASTRGVMSMLAAAVLPICIVRLFPCISRLQHLTSNACLTPNSSNWWLALETSRHAAALRRTHTCCDPYSTLIAFTQSLTDNAPQVVPWDGGK